MPNRVLGLAGFIAALAITGCSGSFSLEDRDVIRYFPDVREYRHEYQSIVTMRDRWPTGVPLQILVRYPNHFMDRNNWRRLVVTPEFPGATPVQLTLHPFTVMVRKAQLPWSPGLHKMGTLPPEAHEVRFLAEAQETAQDAFGIPQEGEPPIVWRTIRSTTLVRPVEQVPTIDDATTPADDPKVTDLVARELRLEFVEGRAELEWRFPPKANDSEIRWKEASPTPAERQVVAGTSIALRVSFRESGSEIAFCRFFISQARSYPGAPIEGDLDRLREGFANPDGWTVVVESDPEMALLDSANDKYWSGRFERPLSTVVFTPKPQR